MSDPDVSDDGYWFGRAEAAIKRCGALRKELAESASEIERLREERDAYKEAVARYIAWLGDDKPDGWKLHEIKNAMRKLLASTPKESLPVEEVSR